MQLFDTGCSGLQKNGAEDKMLHMPADLLKFVFFAKKFRLQISAGFCSVMRCIGVSGIVSCHKSRLLKLACNNTCSLNQCFLTIPTDLVSKAQSV